MTVEIKSDGSLIDEFFRLKHEIIKKYGVEPRGDIRNATAEKRLIEQAYLKGYIDGKAEAMQWIPCSERLPDNDRTKLLTLSNGLVEGGYYSDDAWWCIGEYINLEKLTNEVIAWMPLPEPYKEE